MSIRVHLDFTTTDEELPNITIPVLAYSESGQTYLAAYSEPHWIDWVGRFIIKERITHWAPTFQIDNTIKIMRAEADARIAEFFKL